MTRRRKTYIDELLDDDEDEPLPEPLPPIQLEQADMDTRVIRPMAAAITRLRISGSFVVE